MATTKKLKLAPQEKEVLFFWKTPSPFSTWTSCKFTVDGTEYSSLQQYMMAEKARLFGDEETREKIMNTVLARDQQLLGRKIANFQLDKWTKSAYGIACDGNLAKFTQNPKLGEMLLDTKDCILAEASFDQTWGIGMDELDPRSTDQVQWKGQNLTGKILMNVRKIMEEMKYNPDSD